LNKDDGDMDDEDDVILSSLPVRVTQESDRARYVREHSWEHIKKNEETEKWTVLKLIEKEDEKSDRIFSRLMTSSDSLLNCDLSPSQYINKIAYPVVAPIIDPTLVPEISWHQIKEMPLDKKILNIMIKVQILQHSELLELLNSSNSDVTSELHYAIIVENMKNVCNIIKGVWIVKSSILNMSPLKLHCRNYFLSKFALGPTSLDILEIAQSIGQTTAFVIDLISPFAHRIDRKWTLNKLPDQDFIKNNTKLCDGFLKTWTNNSDSLRQTAITELAHSPHTHKCPQGTNA
jgi:hypothetical protein